MAGNLEIKNANGKTVTLKNPDTNVSDIVVDLADNASKTYVTSVNKKRRNYLINGNFQFWDYATSQTSSGYGSDNRWVNGNTGSTKTHSIMTSEDTERALFESTYYSRTVVSSVIGANNHAIKTQLIEDVTKLAGKTVTLSFWAKADSAKNIAVSKHQRFGTGGAPSVEVSSHVNTISLTTTWKKHTVTVNIPSIVGKTLGADGVHTSCTFFQFWFDAGSGFNLHTNSLGQQSGTFDIAEIKLEDGSVATDGWSPYDGEWGSEAIARQRYLFIIDYLTMMSSSSGRAHSTYLIDMRQTPSVSFKDGAGNSNVYSVNGINNVVPSAGGVGASNKTFIMDAIFASYPSSNIYIRSVYLSAEL